jgi:hypothetical protein
MTHPRIFYRLTGAVARMSCSIEQCGPLFHIFGIIRAFFGAELDFMHCAVALDDDTLFFGASGWAQFVAFWLQSMD